MSERRKQGPTKKQLWDQIESITTNRNMFCKAVNDIARAVGFEGKDCYAPEAVLRKVKELKAIERQLAEVREPMCAVCAGDKEAAKRINCICDGIGTQWGELEGMRGELQKTIAELESATAELTTLRQSLQRAAEERDGFMKIALELCNHDEGWLAAKYVEVTKPLPASDGGGE